MKLVGNKQTLTRYFIKILFRADGLVKVWKFSDVRGTKSVCWWFGSVLPHYQHTLTMGTELLPETSENLHILTLLSAWKNFTEFCRRKSFKTYMTFYHYSPIFNLRVPKNLKSKQCSIMSFPYFSNSHLTIRFTAVSFKHSQQEEENKSQIFRFLFIYRQVQLSSSSIPSTS